MSYFFLIETPPRAWGRPSTPTQTDLAWRNTPTCVGKTRHHCIKLTLSGKHPHVRGEDNSPPHELLRISETPPRAWGRRDQLQHPSCLAGNTPTCVGKTGIHRPDDFLWQKHPHVRGEDVTPSSTLPGHLETPPRAWGRPTPPVATAPR